MALGNSARRALRLTVVAFDTSLLSGYYNARSGVGAGSAPAGATGFDQVLAFTVPDRNARGRVVRLGPVLDSVIAAHASRGDSSRRSRSMTARAAPPRSTSTTRTTT